jgi:hypothetical protein
MLSLLAIITYLDRVCIAVAGPQMQRLTFSAALIDADVMERVGLPELLTSQQL